MTIVRFASRDRLANGLQDLEGRSHETVKCDSPCVYVLPLLLFFLAGCAGEADSGVLNQTGDGGDVVAGVATVAGRDTLPQTNSTVHSPTAMGSRTRRFRFNYSFTLTDLQAGQKLRVWMPVPPSTELQTVQALEHRLPAVPSFHDEAKYGNRILYFETAAPADGEITVDVPYEIQRREVNSTQQPVGSKAGITVEDRELFLHANQRVPLTGKPLELLRGVDLLPNLFQRGRQLFDVVDSHVAYKKQGSGWGRGDVLWVCDSRYGNCTDFHSLFISLARSQEMPARFEIGFPIPTDTAAGSIAGYHCWAWFYGNDHGWVPVDISEADKHPETRDHFYGKLTADRVLFTVGRDIDLSPRQRGPALNFFVYPYVEVNGQPLPAKQIKLRFSFADMK